MSYEAMAKVRGSGLTDGTIVDVLEALAFCLNDSTGKCCPSTLRIAQLARRSPNVVRLTLKKLEADGLISSTQLPGRERYFKLFLDRLPKAKPLSEVKGVSEVEPLTEVTGAPCQKCEGTPVRTERGPLSEVKPEQGSEQGREQGREQVGGAMRPSDSQTSLFVEAEQPAEKPAKKREPLVPFPDELPDEWREAALIARPDIDPQFVFDKIRARLHGTKNRKTLANWRGTFLNWIGREYRRISTPARPETRAFSMPRDAYTEDF